MRLDEDLVLLVLGPLHLAERVTTACLHRAGVPEDVFERRPRMCGFVLVAPVFRVVVEMRDKSLVGITNLRLRHAVVLLDVASDVVFDALVAEQLPDVVTDPQREVAAAFKPVRINAFGAEPAEGFTTRRCWVAVVASEAEAVKFPFEAYEEPMQCRVRLDFGVETPSVVRSCMSEKVCAPVTVAGDILGCELRAVRHSGFKDESVKLFVKRCLVVAGYEGLVLGLCLDGEAFFQRPCHV